MKAITNLEAPASGLDDYVNGYLANGHLSLERHVSGACLRNQSFVERVHPEHAVATEKASNSNEGQGFVKDITERRDVL